EWLARQITEAFPWDQAPHYLIRDRDQIYGSVVTRRLRAMGIRDKPTATASPWQNGFAERTADRIDPARVFGPHHCPGRDAFTPGPEILRRLLQLRQNASILEQGCARFSPGAANRCDQFTRHPRRTSSPLRPCLSFRYTQPLRLTDPERGSPVRF